ncbi:MAG: EcoAI/FtnUII family type I restriction enzme subunit R [Dehalococcoidia bacterium]
MLNEAETCRASVVPALRDAGWEREPHLFTEQTSFTDGRILVAGGAARRRAGKRADYLLRYTRDFPIAVVEAKATYKSAADGLQQAMEYAEILGLRFAYATNGHGIIEHDYLTGAEHSLDRFPTPDELWKRLKDSIGLGRTRSQQVLTPSYHQTGNRPRYYQEIAINRVVQAVLHGRRRMLLTMATGTGKTTVAFQICWKLWSMRWNRDGTKRRPRILYLADRNILADAPKENTFAPFGDAVDKIEGGVAKKSREIYFATYQSLAQDERRPGLYHEYPPDFFDLIIVDECHRGSARETSTWREILTYFRPALQLGMTATPLREESRDSYRYFGTPLYVYSLRQGIEDGFLAPYRVRRILTSFDAAGWRPGLGERDRYGQEIPDGEYSTRDFERTVALRARTEAIARHLTQYLNATDRMAKTIVFCVDQEHASEMRMALINLNSDLVSRYPDYVCRVTANEAEIGVGHLRRFQDIESEAPVILTTSQLLTTGVDAPTCKNIVLARVVNSMTEFKQIIGRGTRVRDDYGKLYFTILDYTGSATRLFADPEFDGDPVDIVEVAIDDSGAETGSTEAAYATEQRLTEIVTDPNPEVYTGEGIRRHKYYVDGGRVEIAVDLVQELDADGRQLRVVSLTQYAGEKVRALWASSSDLRVLWSDPAHRAEIVAALAERGIDFEALAQAAGIRDTDPFDLLCHLAYNAPVRTRRERADRLRRDRKDFFDQYGPEARAILEDLLDRYAQHGTAQLTLPDALKLPPISDRGNVSEIMAQFGGAAKLREAVEQLQALLYAA